MSSTVTEYQENEHENTEEKFVATMREKFYSNLMELVSKKKDNSYLFSKEKYLQLLKEVKEAKAKERKKRNSLDYRRLRRFDVISVSGHEKLIAPVKGNSSVHYYVAMDDLFGVLHDTHKSIGHGGRTRMEKELSRKYKNISKEIIMVYINLCKQCQGKKNKPLKGLVTKPMLFKELNSRCQVDLIDMQSNSDGDFRFILNYQDHLTKFVFLRPLKNKRAEEVAETLIDIFTVIGAPSILQSDNGREFANSIVNALKEIWPELKIVHGKPRHSQSQGSVERANQDAQNMLITWMQTNNTSHWAQGLRFIQFMKNRSFHQGIQRSPYEAMFGCKPKLGLSTSHYPAEVIQKFASEEDLEEVENEMENALNSALNEDNAEIEDNVATESENNAACFFCTVCEKEATNAHTCILCKQVVHAICGEGTDENEGYGSKIICNLCKNKKEIMMKRSLAHDCLHKQAKKMKKSSDKKFSPGTIGDNICIPVPDVDRGRTDPRTVIGVILNVEDELYKVGTESGILKQLYARSEFTVLKEKFISLESIPKNEISLRAASSNQSLTGGQGFSKCFCTTKCTTNRCNCKRLNALCNSKCHKNSDCKNK